MSEESDFYHRVKRRLFNSTRPRDVDVSTLEEIRGTEIKDRDIASWALHTIRRRFGFKPQQREEDSDA